MIGSLNMTVMLLILFLFAQLLDVISAKPHLHQLPAVNADTTNAVITGSTMTAPVMIS